MQRSWDCEIMSVLSYRQNKDLSMQCIRCVCVCVSLCAFAHLEVGLLQDPGQFGCAVVFNLEAADVAQDLRHQLHVVVLHCLQLYLLQLFVSLGETEKLSEARGEMVVVFCIVMTSKCGVSICIVTPEWELSFVAYQILIYCGIILL